MNAGGMIVIYFVFLIAYLTFSFAGIYHLRRFGYAGDLTKAIIVAYTLLSVAVVVLSIIGIFYQIVGF